MVPKATKRAKTGPRPARQAGAFMTTDKDGRKRVAPGFCRLTVFITEDLRTPLLTRALEANVTASDVIQAALEMYLKRKPVRGARVK